MLHTDSGFWVQVSPCMNERDCGCRFIPVLATSEGMLWGHRCCDVILCGGAAVSARGLVGVAGTECLYGARLPGSTSSESREGVLVTGAGCKRRFPED